VKRTRTAPTNLHQIPVEQNIPGRPGVTRQVLSRDSETGATTLLQTMPAGYRPPNGESPGSRRFEMHSCHEELFALAGTFRFGTWHTLRALGYLNHPPYWVHPADQFAETSVTFLIKFSGPLDFFFEDIPDDWDGKEYVHASAPSGAVMRGLSELQVDNLDWVPARRSDGMPLDFHIKVIWHDDFSGWSTFLQRYPSGWQGAGEPRVFEGGDEWFVLSGSLHLGDGVTLKQGDYYCEPDRRIDGGMTAHSQTGATVIRWCKDLDLVAAAQSGPDRSGP
jgi:hypothetical protein